MKNEKLEKVAGAVWKELNLQLLGAGNAGLDSYVKVIVNLLDSAFNMFTKGDRAEMIRLYEKIVNRLDQYLVYLKKEYEFKQEG